MIQQYPVENLTKLKRLAQKVTEQQLRHTERIIKPYELSFHDNQSLFRAKLNPFSPDMGNFDRHAASRLGCLIIKEFAHASSFIYLAGISIRAKRNELAYY